MEGQWPELSDHDPPYIGIVKHCHPRIGKLNSQRNFHPPTLVMVAVTAMSHVLQSAPYGQSRKLTLPLTAIEF